jgi:hypothetical protein
LQVCFSVSGGVRRIISGLNVLLMWEVIGWQFGNIAIKFAEEPFSSAQCILPFARPTVGCGIYRGLSLLFNDSHSWIRGVLASVRPFVFKCYVLRHSAALTGGTGNCAENYTERRRCFAAMQPTRERTEATTRASGSSSLRR